MILSEMFKIIRMYFNNFLFHPDIEIQCNCKTKEEMTDYGSDRCYKTLSILYYLRTFT